MSRSSDGLRVGVAADASLERLRSAHELLPCFEVVWVRGLNALFSSSSRDFQESFE